MAKVVKCPVCTNYYNADTYAECPYCRSGAASGGSDSGISGSRRQIPPTTGFGGILDIMGRKKNKPSDENQDSSGLDGSRTDADQERPSVNRSAADEPAADEFTADKPVVGIPAVDWPAMDRPAEDRPAEDRPDDLRQEIQHAGRTVGTYVSPGGGREVQPPVGWLVGTRGACYGQSFCLRSGRNRIGRSAEMDVNLDDGSVSRTCAAVVIYDPKEQVFSAMPGESSSLCYVNNHALYQRMELQGYDLMEFGDAGLNQFIFVPLCGNQFRWEDYPPERK